MAPVALMVMDVVTLSIGRSAMRSRMSASESIATPTLPTSPSARGMVRVIAHLGRQVEGARKTGLAGIQEELEPLVGGFGRTESGVLAHRPELRAVHFGVHAPGVGEGAGLTQLRFGIPTSEILCPVDRLDLNS